MDFSLSKDHQMLQDVVREFVDSRVTPRMRQMEEQGHVDPELIEAMKELGLFGICLPARYGGSGMDYLSLAIACEELERGDTAFRTLVSVHTGLCSLGIFQWGSEEQKQRYLPGLAAGDKLGAFGLTEPDHGSDAAHIRTRAERDGDDYLLSGEKTWISLANTADVFLVFARTGPSEGYDGITAFIVERDFEGFSSKEITGKMGIRAGDVGSLVLDECRVPAENVLGEPGQGFKIAMSCLDNGRLTVAAGAVGSAQACLEESIDYATERRTFGEEIGKHQLVQQMIAKMVRGIESARLLTYRAAWLKNEGKRNTRETSLAKWAACDVAFDVAADAVQVHGANGFTNQYAVERHLRNAKGPMIYEGTREIHQLIQAQYALGYRQDKPLERELPSWPFAADQEGDGENQ